MDGMAQFYWRMMPLLIIDIVLKGLALWVAARKEHKIWFVALFIINSAGLVPLVYLLFFSKWEWIEKRKKKLFPKRKK